MKTKMMIAALAIAMGTAGFAPSEVEAKPKYKKAYKQHKKYHKKVAKHHYNHHHKSYYRPYRVKYDRPKYEEESFGIYTTPTGGLGLHYSESSSKYRYGYPYGYGGYHQVGGYGFNIGF